MIFRVTEQPGLDVGLDLEAARDGEEIKDECSEYRLQPGVALPNGKTRLKPVL